MGSTGPRGTSGVAAEEAGSVIRRYQERVARNPSSLAWVALADAYRKAGRPAEAIAACRVGLERFPRYSTARLILAKAQIDEGLLDEALGELNLLLAASPRDGEAHRLAGELHLQAGRWQDARRHLEAAVDLGPDDREARHLLDVVAGDGSFPDSSPLARVLEDDLFATPSFAAACLAQGLAEEAAQICLRILKKNPDDARAHALLAPALKARITKRRGA
jgi:tetratricopeptide (TPR) repeat protein